MRSFSSLIQKAQKGTSKPRMVITPAHDVRILSLLPEIITMTKPVLIGRAKQIQEQLINCGVNVSGFEILDEQDESTAITTAVELVHSNKVEILMQGSVDNTLFSQMVFDRKKGIGATSILSHISMLEHSKEGKCCMITDTLINKAPTLRQKIAILENALVVAKALGIKRPKVAALAALEYVNPSIQSTLDAAVLSKMGDRHQFGDAIVGGPLDIDCAVSREASKRKRVSSKVTSDVDIYLVCDVESGYSFAEFLSLLGRMEMAGIIVGGQSPVIPNRACTTRKAKIAEVALACLLSKGRQNDV
ncbi:MAG TPA: phosphate acyltransferase [Deltaproteobacteria bacterium]|nr:phosphate acyltransferase [Deltaproteobacteria bacterium]HPJ93760.1 phosphate acyltransferase [Deltaproteobacteria bacterium]